MSGRSVIVSGAGRGLGRALAKGFAAAGARVTIAGRTEADVRRVADEIRDAGERAQAVRFDAREEADCRMVVERARAEFGAIDSVIVKHGNGGENTGESAVRSIRYGLRPEHTRTVVSTG